MDKQISLMSPNVIIEQLLSGHIGRIKFIVEAVSNHDRLLAENKRMRKALEKILEESPEWFYANRLIKSALGEGGE